MATVAQTDFSGGMITRLSPERLPQNAYSFGKNIETRDGTPRTRRGSLRLYDDIAGQTFQGAGIFRSPSRGDKVETMLVAQGQKVYRMIPPLDRVEMTLPGTLTEVPVRFVQAIDKMYLFHGEGQSVWEWDGEEDNPWTVVAEPETGKNLVGTERVTYAYGRFWMATARDTVEYSDILSTSVPLSQGFNVNHGEGESVNAIFQIGNGQLILAKDRSLYQINGANAFTDTSQLTADDALSRTIGVFAQDTVVQPGADTIFLSRDGLYSLSVNNENNLRLTDIAISDPIADRFARINWEKAHLAQGIWFDNYYLLAVPVGGGQTNTTILVYDFLTKAWVSEWELYVGDPDAEEEADRELPTTAFAVSRFIVSTRLGVNRLYAINELGGVMELLKDNLKDNYSSPDHYVDFAGSTSGSHYHLEESEINGGGFPSLSSGYLIVDFSVPVSAKDTVQRVFEVKSTDNDCLALGMNASNQIEAQLDVDGVTKWKIATTGLNFADGLFHKVTLYQDGSTDEGAKAEILIDGELVQQSEITDVASELWTSSITNGAAIVGAKVGSSVFLGRVRGFEWLGPNGRADSTKQIFPFNDKDVLKTDNGGGYTIGRTVSDVLSSNNVWDFITGPPAATTWGGASPAPANIEATFISRGYGAASIIADGSNPKVEYTVAHANPKLTSSLVGSKPFSSQTLITEQTYDKTKYEVNNKSDWASTNAGADHDTFGREDYPPIELGPSDSFALRGTAGGLEPEEVTMGIETRHTHTVTGNIHSPWIRLKLENTQGRFDLIDVVLTTKEQPIFTGRGL
jgi:hypothetical protein